MKKIPRKYDVGEKVHVPYTDKYYEAKITKAELRHGSQWHYMLHYTGWGKKFDEWVEESGTCCVRQAADLHLVSLRSRRVDAVSDLQIWRSVCLN